MIYAKLFKLSKLSNHEITKRLEIDHTARKRFEKSKKIDCKIIAIFCKQLDVNPKDVAELIRLEILDNYKR